MPTLNDMEQWVADKALGSLYADDSNPNVGMGLFPSTAMEWAMRDLKETATLFGGGYDFALLQINQKNVEEFVKRRRGY
jgi:hypothetical protein